MAIHCKDGAWLTTKKLTKLECSKCGDVSISQYPMNDREEDDMLREHANNVHGRIDRG